MDTLKEKLGNNEVRVWYKAKDEAIPSAIDEAETLEIEAWTAYSKRNEYSF